MKSIMQTKKDQCFICNMLYNDPFAKITEEHHIFMGTANRKLSEAYGLKVYLCVMHHRTGNKAVHRDRNMCLWLMGQGKIAFKRRYPNLEFRDIFGKEFVFDEPAEEVQPESTEPGFWFVEEKELEKLCAGLETY